MISLSKSYVIRESIIRGIGTLGCSTSPRLCVPVLNIPEGRGSESAENPGITLAMWTTEGKANGQPFAGLFALP